MWAQSTMCTVVSAKAPARHEHNLAAISAAFTHQLHGQNFCEEHKQTRKIQLHLEIHRDTNINIICAQFPTPLQCTTDPWEVRPKYPQMHRNIFTLPIFLSAQVPSKILSQSWTLHSGYLCALMHTLFSPILCAMPDAQPNTMVRSIFNVR